MIEDTIGINTIQNNLIGGTVKVEYCTIIAHEVTLSSDEIFGQCVSTLYMKKHVFRSFGNSTVSWVSK